MICNIEPTPNDRVCEFSSNFALNSFSAGRVKFVDCSCIDGPGCDEPCLPFCLQVDSELLTDCLPDQIQELQECHENPPKFLNGLLRSFGYSYQDSTSSFGVAPYSEFLQNKPIQSESFENQPLRLVISRILRIYGGLSPDVYNIDDLFDPDNTNFDCQIQGPVTGNSILAELAKLAQAGCASLFTQVDGRLTIESWKDHNSPVEFEIPCEYIISAEKAEFDPNRIAAIRMRGAQVPSGECNNSLTNNENGPGPAKKCVFSGIKTTSVPVTFNNLNGTQEDIQNGTAQAFGQNGQTIDNIQSTGNGSATGDVSAANGQQIGCNPECVNVQITGNTRNNQNDFQGFQNGVFYGYGFNQTGGYGWGTNERTFFDRYNQMLNNQFPIPYQMFGLGDFVSGFGPTTNSNSNGNLASQQSRSQCELLVTENADNACGNSLEDHENQYVFNKNLLFKIARRRFEELKMADNVWNVEVPYLPCLKINQVVTFQTPETEHCESREIKGIVGGISIEYKKGSNLPITMRLAIMDTECLKCTEYTSGNLLQTYCAHSAASEINPWTAAEFSLEQGVEIGDCISIYASGIGVGFARYEETKLDPNCEYTISFDWEFIQGEGPVSFNASSGAGQNFVATPTISFGSYSQNLGSGLSNLDFEFNLQAPQNPTFFKIYNLQLNGICTAPCD